MNIYFDEIENKSVDELRKTLENLTELNGKQYEYYFKVYPGSIGLRLTIKFVCEELQIEKDITNYNNW